LHVWSVGLDLTTEPVSFSGLWFLVPVRKLTGKKLQELMYVRDTIDRVAMVITMVATPIAA
jgi:hypothetical protein